MPTKELNVRLDKEVNDTAWFMTDGIAVTEIGLKYPHYTRSKVLDCLASVIFAQEDR